MKRSGNRNDSVASEYLANNKFQSFCGQMLVVRNESMDDDRNEEVEADGNGQAERIQERAEIEEGSSIQNVEQMIVDEERRNENENRNEHTEEDEERNREEQSEEYEILIIEDDDEREEPEEYEICVK